MTKAQARRHQKNKAYYANQFSVTAKNKARRAAKRAKKQAENQSI